MNYCNKYCPNNKGTRLVFDIIYNKILPAYGISGNFYATPGENIEAYLNYATYILRLGNSKAVFVENDLRRFNRLKKRLKKSTHPTASKIEIVYGNIMNHEGIINLSKASKATRIEDYGLGLGVAPLLRMLIPQLDRQRNLTSVHHETGKRLLKTQIFDASMRPISSDNCVKLLNQYLDVINTKIVSINGQKPGRLDNLFRAGKIVKTYVDKKRPHQVQKVRKHMVKLADNKREPELHLYTYCNGGYMLTGVLVYR